MSQRIRRAIFASLCAALLCASWAGRASGSGFSGGPGATGTTWPLAAPTGLGTAPAFQGATDQDATFTSQSGRGAWLLASTGLGGLCYGAVSNGTPASAVLGFKTSKTLTNNTATSVISYAMTDRTHATGQLIYGVLVTNATDVQAETGIVDFGYVCKGTAVTAGTVAKNNTVQEVSAGTLTVTFTNSTGSGSASLQANINTSLTTPTDVIGFTLNNPSLLGATQSFP